MNIFNNLKIKGSLMIYAINLAKKCTLLSLVLLSSNILAMDKRQQAPAQASADRQVQQQLQMARLTTLRILEEVDQVMPEIVIKDEDRNIQYNENKNQQVDMKKINKLVAHK